MRVSRDLVAICLGAVGGAAAAAMGLGFVGAIIGGAITAGFIQAIRAYSQSQDFGLAAKVLVHQGVFGAIGGALLGLTDPNALVAALKSFIAGPSAG